MELNQTSICYYEKKLAHISAATESADSIVPDTFPDIGRIVSRMVRRSSRTRLHRMTAC